MRAFSHKTGCWLSVTHHWLTNDIQDLYPAQAVDGVCLVYIYLVIWKFSAVSKICIQRRRQTVIISCMYSNMETFVRVTNFQPVDGLCPRVGAYFCFWHFHVFTLAYNQKVLLERVTFFSHQHFYFTDLERVCRRVM